jgi:phosphoglycerol transferase
MHIFRGAYFNVPPVVLLLLWMLEPTRSFRTADGAWRRGRLVFAAATAAMVAVTDTMTATFAVLLLGLTALLVAVRDRRPSRLLLPAAAVGVVLAVFLLSNIPTLLYASEHGKNRVAGARAPEESVYWGLKLSDMVLPPADYRIHALGAPARELAHTPVPSEGGQYLGLLGVLGFIGALYTLLARTLGRPTEPAPGSDQGEEEWALAGRLAVLTLLAVLIGTVHGLSAVIAGLGFTQVRVWNRIVVVIGFLVLLLLALGLERLTPWVRARVGGRGVAVLLVGLMGVALLDQAKVPHAYAAQKAEWASDARFGRAVQARLPKGTAVLQLPYMPFPESGPIERMQDYDPLKGYIHTEGLRWSYGALKGRPAGDWQSALRPARGPQLVMDACATGFEALWLDRFGYADPSVEQSLVFALGHPADVTSPNGRLLLFDVRDACDEARRTGGAQLSARAEALLPAQPYDAD